MILNAYSTLKALPMAYALLEAVRDQRERIVNFKLIDLNSTLEGFLGQTYDSLMGRTVQEIESLFGEPEIWVGRMSRVVCNGCSAEFEAYVSPQEKRYRIYLYPLSGYAEDRVVFILIDITSVTRKMEELFALGLMLHDIILEVDEDFRFMGVYTSEKGKLYLPEEEMVGKTIYQVFAHDQPRAEAFADLFEKARQSGKREILEYKSSRFDRWLLAGVIHTRTREKDHYIVSVSDITETKTLEEERVDEREALFRAIFEQSPIGVTIGGDEYGFYPHIDGLPAANAMYQKIVGRSLEELEKTPWTEYTHPEDLEEDVRLFRQLQAGEIDSYHQEKRYLRPDGSEVWVHLTVSRLKTPTPSGINHICLVEDITQRKRLEENLQESERSKAVLLDNLVGMAYRCAFDKNWTMEYVSGGCYELTGYPPRPWSTTASVPSTT